MTYYFFFQLLKDIGNQIERFDVSSPVSSSISDKGLSVIAKYCTKLESLGLGLLQSSELTCAPLVPMMDTDHALLIKELKLSVKHVSIITHTRQTFMLRYD